MKDTVPTSKGQSKLKKMNFYANIFFVCVIAATVGFNFYEKYRKEEIYDALYMSFTKVKEVEYGTEVYDTLDFVENVENGQISDYTKELDTNTIGVQELNYEMIEEDVSKQFKIKVEVKDTKKPVIELKQKTITIYVGNTYKYKNNIKSVKDEVDGDLPYVDKAPKESNKGYYTIESNFNGKKVGTYTVTIKAVDKNGNKQSAKYTIKVIPKPVVKKPVVVRTAVGNYNGPSSVDTSSVVNAAKSLIGSNYAYGGASPSTGFDCSGFVYYIYGLFGKSLNRTASGMLSNGHSVSESNMKPGDIIIWTTSRSYPSATHVAIYAGDGNMIHSANKRQGVIVTNVKYWKNDGRNIILSIRRV